ncbi:ParB/RepB/Spo0J family partition protein [Pleionea litopenaei]|uniref:Probable chromosome-partitioning protein ParB n=1 Tax=Pleionea litopenaei TaxID=3070815 RepID=A0AA51RR77_9GAMM|nr:ParB/RepB/Spo0J family partition protein [Pleionea sp. HL-JVS1]WMS86024.1 ParB/RepB/Spo0J family partition protein [Pleionea sp. HL-JVS1]
MSKRLGRGLDAFISKKIAENKSAEESGSATKEGDTVAERGELRKLPIEFLQPGQYQPRKIMTDEALEELAESIKAQGIIQPIVVRSVAKDKYEIIAGERRWRASQLAKLSEVPVLVKDVPDEAAIAMALIENIQREDLNAIEEATALQRLMEEFGLTHQQTADAVGKSRTTVTNLLRLLQLAEACRTMLERGDIEMGHARALLSLDKAQQSEIARQVVAKGLTVRETEKLVRKTINPIKVNNPVKDEDPHISKLEQQIADKFGAPVSIQHSPRGKGKLVLSYNNLDELDGILANMGLKEDF